MRFLRGSLRGRLFLLVLLSILPGILLTIYSVITEQHHEVWVVLLIGITSLIVAWLGGDALIVRRVNTLIEQSKRLSSGDLGARSRPGDHFGFLGSLAQAFDRMAASLEEQTGQLQHLSKESAALYEIVHELATQQDVSKLLELIASQAAALQDADQATISLYDPVLDELVISMVVGYQVPIGTRIRMGEGATGQAAQTLQPVTVDDYHAWINRLPKFEAIPFSSMMQVPMIYHGELLGVIGVAGIEPATRKFSQADVQLLTLFAGQAASAIRNSRLFVETRNRLREQEALNDISTALRVAQDIDEMLSTLLEKTLTMVDATVGSIWLCSPEDHVLQPAVSQGFPQIEISMRPGEGIAGSVFSTGEAYFSLDLKNDPLIQPSARGQLPAGISGACIPIPTAQGILGVLFIGFQTPQQMNTDQVRLVTMISEMAGNAIHRMQLHEQTRSQIQRLSALRTIDIAIASSLDMGNTLQVVLDQVIAQLGVDAACFLVLNPHEQTFDFGASRGFTTDALRYTRLRFGEGHAGRAALEQRTMHIPDLKTGQSDFERSPSFAAEGFLAYYAVPLVTRGQVKGVLEIFHRSPLECDREWLEFLEALANQAAIAVENASLFNDLQRSNIELNLAYNSTLEGWSHALDLRDRETEGHSQRVTEIALRLARTMEVNEADLVHIRRGALLHDIGKLGIPDSLLLKPGPLNDEERELIRKHPMIAYELLAPIAYLRPALEIPYCHHEKWDGTGYPRGLKGEQIPLAARIFAVVDVWDALLSDRVYRKGWTIDQARAYLLEQSGKHFDPRAVKMFFSLLEFEDQKE